MNKQQLTAAELALYYGQKYVGYSEEFSVALRYTGTIGPIALQAAEGGTMTFKPILRRMEDMTEAEVEQWNIEYYPNISETDPERLDNLIRAIEAARTKYLLSIGIDLFGWIDAGLAVDRKTLEK